MTDPIHHRSLFGSYFTYVGETETPQLFHRWCVLSAAAAILGRQVYLPFGDFRIFPNIYIQLIGEPATRKSTAIKLAKKVLTASGYEHFSYDRTSMEQFLVDLEGITDDNGKLKKSDDLELSDILGMDKVPKEVFVCADEFLDFMGPSNLQFLSLLGTLWDWDSEDRPYDRRLKQTRSISIYQPTVNLLTGNTHESFSLVFPPQAIGQGILSRMLFVYSEPTGRQISKPKTPSPELRQRVAEVLLDIKANVHGECTIDPTADRMLDTIYRTQKGIDDVRFKYYNNRRHIQLLKLCMLIAAIHRRIVIRDSDVIFANTLLSFTEHFMPKAFGEYGKSRHSDVTAKIISVLNAADAPVTMQTLWQQCQSDLENAAELQKLIQGLVMANKVQFIHKAGASPIAGYLPVRTALKQELLYVDYNLLSEAKMLHTQPLLRGETFDHILSETELK